MSRPRKETWVVRLHLDALGRRIEALQRQIPLATRRTALVSELVRIGLEAVEANPSLLGARHTNTKE